MIKKPYAICNNKECIKKDLCERYSNDTLELYNFKAICYDENSYKWLIEKKVDIVKVEED